METVPISPKRKAQLEEYARRRGQDTATAVDEVLGDAFEAEDQEHVETVACVVQAYESVKARRTQPVAEFLEEIRTKRGFPR
jgi:hypothetical protein